MADSSSTPLSRTSTPPTDLLFHSDPPYSVPNPAGSPRLPRCLAGAFLSGGSGGSGRVPANVNGQSGSGTGAASSSCSQQCKMVEVHGVKVASFPVNGVDLICLPQVFELFLKHLVGGLHTVYTKLKRLDICPVVCTVEQVRALRGLGAIQPGVNRCKLITRADFETLYRDCTNASSRPGRPPKRSLGSRLLPHGLIGPAPLLTHTGLTAAMAEALKLQKMRMMMGFHGNSDQQHRQSNDAESENDDTGGSEASWEKEQRLLSPLQQHRMSDFPFMVMPHPLLPVGLPPASVAMAMNQMSQLSEFANMAALSHVQTEDSKESPPGSPSPCPSLSEDELRRGPTSQSASRASSSSSSSPLDGALAETEDSGDTALKETDDRLMPRPLLKPTNEKLPLASQPLSINHANPGLAPFLLVEGLSSMETLLTNIQGLLKGALDSARSHTEQSRLEKTELKLQVETERDARYTLQRQLSTELQNTVWIQRRLKKEKKAKRKLQEELELQILHRRTVIPEKEEINQQEPSAAQENSTLK